MAALGERGVGLLRQRDRQRRRFIACVLPIQPDSLVTLIVVVVLRGKELSEVGFHREPRLQRGERGVGGDLRGIEVQLFPPHQSPRNALLHYHLKEAAEDLQAIALPDARQAGVVG